MADATPLETANALDYVEDRAFKQLALNGAPLDASLRNWVDRYVPGPPVPACALEEKTLMRRSIGIPATPRRKPAGYIVGAAVRERVAARVLAAARERQAAEEKAFMRRSVGIPANPRPKPAGYTVGAAVRQRVAARHARVEELMALRKGRPRPRGLARFGPIGRPVLSREAREQAAKEARIQAREKGEAQRRREAAAANVAELIQMRLAGEQRKLGRACLLA
ncbi:hypothetical protein C8F04DRAFT_1281908 [Mycena alexandri]|uniref:Uncharacterized protein n=1 Tax=Mycena alexandri TaxID=1745969 RepID=A0AAD6WL33_9AGAR|nr:hypothetical protein C8F04DRAFT_1281908 [Mycena alexandri]